jgi:hypothetical protein
MVGMADLDRVGYENETEDINDHIEDGTKGEFNLSEDAGEFLLEDIISEVRQTTLELEWETDGEDIDEGILPQSLEEVEFSMLADIIDRKMGQQSDFLQSSFDTEKTEGDTSSPSLDPMREAEIARQLQAMFDDEGPEEFPEEPTNEKSAKAGFFTSFFRRLKPSDGESLSEGAEEWEEPYEPLEQEEPKDSPKEGVLGGLYKGFASLKGGAQEESEDEGETNESYEPQIDELDELEKQLSFQKRGLRLRLFPAFGLSLLLVGAALIQIYSVPLLPPVGVGSSPAGNMVVQLLLCAMVVGLLYREMGEGLRRLFSLTPNQQSISSLGLIAALFHGVLQIPSVQAGESFLFFGPVAVLGLLAVVWSRYLYLKLRLSQVQRLASSPVKQQLELIKSLRVSQIIKAEMEEEHCPADDLFLIRREKTKKTFDTQRILEKTTQADKWDEKIAPVMVILILVATAVVVLITRQGSQLLTVLTVLAVTLVPLCAHFMALAPMLWAARRSPESVILNSTEAEEFTHCNGLIFHDTDLFDKESIILKGMRVLGENNRIDELLIDVASVFYHLEMGLTGLFLPMLNNDVSVLKPVSQASCYRGEGIRATVEGEEIVIGTGEFMQKCGLLSPNASQAATPFHNKIKNIYVAKGKEAACIFTVGYVVRGSTKLELDSLYHNGIYIILDTRDMHLTKKNLVDLFGVEEDGIFTVDTGAASSLPQSEGKQKKGVYILEDNLFSFADTIWACRHIKGMEWRNIAISIVLSVISFVLFFVLMALNGIDQVTVEKLLLYLIICCIPFGVNSII